MAFAAAAAAAQGTDAERCATLTGQPDLAIQHCTRAIESGKLRPDELARMHYNRAAEWAAKGDHDRAIADYDEAIRLDPKFADAYYNRGHARANKGDSDRAISDYDAAIRLNPADSAARVARAVEWTLKGDYAQALAGYDAALKLAPKSDNVLFGRGRLQLYAGNLQQAIADMEQAWKMEPNLFTAIWLYLARKRAGLADAEEALDGTTRAERASAWPGQIVVLYLGRTDVDSVFAAATDTDPRRQAEQRCEASFYVAHWHLLRNERDRARALLGQARDGCPRDFLEYEGAVAELRRLDTDVK